MEYGFNKRRDGNASNRDFRGDRDSKDYHRRKESGDRDQRSGGFRRDRDDRANDRDESVFSKKVRAGKRRTYFFDVRKTRGEDYFITITESTRREDGYGYRRHKIFLYKEDFNRFVASLNEVVNHVKTDLMPNFDYEEFDRRQAEWESANAEAHDDEETDDFDESDDRDDSSGRAKKNLKDDDDMNW